MLPLGHSFQVMWFGAKSLSDIRHQNQLIDHEDLGESRTGTRQGGNDGKAIQIYFKVLLDVQAILLSCNAKQHKIR